MRLLALIVAVAGCGSGGSSGGAPSVFAADESIRACAGTVAWAEKGGERCRIDREVKGVGCVRAIADRAQVGLYVWKGCGAIAAPVAATIARKDPVTVVTLPEALRDPVWAAAIGEVLVGPKAVVGEGAATGALAWVLDASHPEASADLDGIYRFVPRWTAGVPQPPALAAAVLDPKVARADATRAWSKDVAIGRDASLVVVDAGAPLEPLAKCQFFDVVGNASAVAAVRTDDRTWTYIAIDGARNPRVPIGCSNTSMLLHLPRGDRGIASELIVAPRRGVFVDLEPTMRALYAEDELEKLVVPPIDLPPCANEVPLRAAQAPCIARGKDWTLRARGEGPPLGWIYERTGHDPAAFMIAQPFAALPGDADDAMEVARRLVGRSRAVKCADERCTNGEAFFGWVFAGGRAGRFDDRGVFAPQWDGGDTPGLPTYEIALAPYDPRPGGSDDPTLLYAAIGGPAVAWARCGAIEVWTAPHAGGVVDRVRHKWTWLYFDRANDTQLASGHCFDADTVVFDAASASIAADVKTGRWATMSVADAKDPAAVRAALHSPP